MKLTLHRFLTLTGLFDNKKDIINAISNKEIKLNTEIITNPKYQFNPNTNSIYWKDKKLEHDKKHYYVVFNKPEGYISEKILVQSDKKSMFDLLDIDKKILNQLSAIGRLDEESSGMIILTDDGKINHKIAHPKSEIEKTYEIELENPISEQDIRKAEQGVIIDLEKNWKHNEYETKPCKIRKISDKILQITLIEGKKREVKRIFDTVGNKVIKLRRISIGNLKLDDLNLEKGKYVFISKDILKKFVL